MSAFPEHESTSVDGGMAASSLVVALLAAGAGALLWAGVAYFTGYEVGYVAWALGAGVGAATVKFGGRGTACAAAAAVLTLAGIAGGKLLGTRFVVEQQFREVCAETFTPALHAELVTDAADLAELDGDADDYDLRLFMVEHAYTAAVSPEDVADEELRGFLADHAPDLRALHANRTPHAQWYAEVVAESRRDFEADFSLVQANVESLAPIDALFVLLGVSTAFGMVRRAGAGARAGAPPDADADVRRAA
jgi:hypothetical protein